MSRIYNVEIVQHLHICEPIEAESFSEAKEIAERMYEDGELEFLHSDSMIIDHDILDEEI